MNYSDIPGVVHLRKRTTGKHNSHVRKWIWRCRQKKWQPFCHGKVLMLQMEKTIYVLPLSEYTVAYQIADKQGGIAETMKKCNGELGIKLAAIVAVTLVAKQWEKAHWNAGMCQYQHSHWEPIKLRNPNALCKSCWMLCISVVGVTVEHVSNLVRWSITRVHILTLWLEYFTNAMVPRHFERDTWKMR